MNTVDAPLGWPVENLPQDRNLVPSGEHSSLVESLHCDAFLAQPLKMENGEIIGSWVCLWNGPVSPKTWDTARPMSAHLSATTHLIELSRPRGIRGLLYHVTTSLFWRNATLPLAVASVAIACLWLEVPYRLGASCWVQAEIQRQVAAPFDGILKSSEVAPGGLVESGDILARLDEKEIVLRIAETRARLEATRKRLDQALAENDVGASAMADLEVQALELDLALWEWQGQNLEIRSPLSGLILRGDLEQSEGVPVQRGQELFEVAPIDRLTVKIGVPASEIAHVEPGMPVRMRLESQTSFVLESSLDTVRPSSEIRDGENVFICVASLENPSGDLRPGMIGKARIETGKRLLGWILFHRFVDYIRLNFPW
mgnify:CR=1 FL=1